MTIETYDTDTHVAVPRIPLATQLRTLRDMGKNCISALSCYQELLETAPPVPQVEQKDGVLQLAFEALLAYPESGEVFLENLEATELRESF